MLPAPAFANFAVDARRLCSVDLGEEVNALILLQEADGAQAGATGLEGCASHHPCKPAEAAG